MKAIGAQNKDILSLFLVEALLIGIFGASIGLLIGIGFGYALSAIMKSSGGGGPGGGRSSSLPIYLISDMARVWMISVGLSILAGILPAIQASRLMPIKALRSQ